MTKRQPTAFLQDILDAIADIETFTTDVDFQAFSANREKTLAVLKSIEIIGEAVKQIPDDIRTQYPNIEWQSISGMRNILVHEYWGIDINVVWATVQNGLPPLKAVVLEILQNC